MDKINWFNDLYSDVFSLDFDRYYPKWQKIQLCKISPLSMENPISYKSKSI